jgi:uncharacterized membrane protein
MYQRTIAHPRRLAKDISGEHAGLLVLALILLAAALRGYHLGYHGLWADETFTAALASQTLQDIVQISAEDVVHPPLFYALLWFWTRLAGNSEFALRTLSAGASMVALPLIYVLGREGWNRRTGLAAAFLWACFPFVLWYAQEARMYALLAAVSLAATLCLVRGLQRDSRPWLIANATLNLIGLYSHYFYVFLLASQALYLAIKFRKYRDEVRRWFLFNAIAGLLYLPWAIALLRSGLDQAGIDWIAPLSPQTVLGAFWQLNAGYHQEIGIGALLVTIVLSSGLIAEAIFGRHGRRSPVRGLMWTQLLLPPLLVALLSLRQPLFYSRFLQIVLPAYLLLAMAGLMRLLRPPLGTAIIVLVALGGLPVLLQMYGTRMRYDQDWQAAIEHIADNATAGDAVAFREVQGKHAYWYYYEGPALNQVELTLEEGRGSLGAQPVGAQRTWLVIWDAAQSCETPSRFVPGPDEQMIISSVACFPSVMVVSYTSQGQSP